MSSRSIPYCDKGPCEFGETFVRSKGQLLYTVDKYFTNGFFTIGRGRYLVEFSFRVPRSTQEQLTVDDRGKLMMDKHGADTEVVWIYERGVLMKVVNFSELKVDPAELRPPYPSVSWLSWEYTAPGYGSSVLESWMERNSAFIEEDRLSLIAADGQLIEIHIPSGRIMGRSVASQVLRDRTSWDPPTIKRKYERVKYPDKFFLPPLKNGRSLEEAAAVLFGLRVPDRGEQHVDLDIHVHALLIDRKGRCELVHATVKPLGGSGPNVALQEKFAAWIKEQTFDIRTLPRKFPKYRYSGFIHHSRHR